MDENVYQSLSRPRMELSYSSSSEEEDEANLRHKHFRDSRAHSHTHTEYEPDRRFTYNSHKVRRKPHDITANGESKHTHTAVEVQGQYRGSSGGAGAVQGQQWRLSERLYSKSTFISSHCLTSLSSLLFSWTVSGDSSEWTVSGDS
ncbi:teneurin-1 isoform X1, partial [Tachysurus ichikawai]